jgi:hypothetical protein
MQAMVFLKQINYEGTYAVTAEVMPIRTDVVSILAEAFT